MQKNEERKKNAMAGRIIVIVIIIAVIGGIWIFKNKNVELDEAAPPAASDKTNKNTNNKGSGDGYFPLHVTEEIDLEELKSYGLPIVIDFGADSCVPCKEMAPVLKKLNEELAGKAIVLFVDVWKYKDLATNYPVQVIPTQILIDSEGNPYTPKKDDIVELVQYSYRDSEKVAFTAHQGGLTEEQLKSILKERGMKE